MNKANVLTTNTLLITNLVIELTFVLLQFNNFIMCPSESRGLATKITGRAAKGFGVYVPADALDQGNHNSHVFIGEMFVPQPLNSCIMCLSENQELVTKIIGHAAEGF